MLNGTVAQAKEKKAVREESLKAIRRQKAEWAARNKQAWTSGEALPGRLLQSWMMSSTGYMIIKAHDMPECKCKMNTKW